MISLNDNTYRDFTLVFAWKGKRYYVGSWPDSQNLPFDLIINATGLPVDGQPKAGSHYIPIGCMDVESDESNAEYCLDAIKAMAPIYQDATDILFHCHAGCNRSAFLCAYWIWLHTDFYMDEIVGQIRKYRGFNCISNSYFCNLLQEIEIAGLKERRCK